MLQIHRQTLPLRIYFQGSSGPQNEAESVAGYLNHCTFVFPHGQSYLANLYSWLADFPHERAHRYMTRSLVTDLKWWLDILKNYHTPRLFLPKPPTRDYDLWVDASSSHGIGLLCKSRWFFWGTRESWRGSPGEGRDIGWLEAVAIELAIRPISADGIRDANVLIRSDNEGAIHAFRKGRSRNHMVNACIRRAEVILLECNLSITLFYVPSALNRADPISRGLRLPDLSLRLDLPPPIAPGSTMPNDVPNTFDALMSGVDISQVAAAEFWSNVATHHNPTRSAVSASLHTSHPRLPRNPRATSHIAPSLHRSHVPASDRLLLWTTPAGREWQTDLEAQFPDSVVFKLFQVMIRSLDHDTRGNYGAGGLLRFTQFCDQVNIREVDRMPAAQELISTFAAAHAGSISDKTLNNWLAGLHFWHLVNGAQWHSADMLRSVRRGLAQMVPPSSHRAKRPPVTIEALTILVQALDPLDPLDTAVSSVACVAFWSCCRLGELIPRSTKDFHPYKHVSRSILPLVVQSLPDSTSFTSFHISWSKTKQEQGENISVTARPHCTDPLGAILAHQNINHDIPATAPLFAYRTDGGWLPLTKSVFISRCNQIWSGNGFPNMPGHAFRIGRTMELLLQGVNPDIIATQGRWSSRAFLEYWRRIKTVLPLFISSSVDTDRLRDIDSVITNYIHRHGLITS